MVRRVAIQGEAGCYHDVAAREFFSGDEVETVPCSSFEELFGRIGSDPTLYGIVAIENTIAGSLLQNHELLRASRLKVIGEYKLRISHVLCSLPSDSLSSVTEVDSHPMALMQCAEFLKRYPSFKLVETEDTAGSARMIAQNSLRGHAAICGRLAAELYGMKILAEGIETNKHNFTRFLILAPDQSVQVDNFDKASFVFSLPHTCGSLSKVLTILSFYDINLTKIQSLPIVGHEWEYRFYVDVSFDSSERYAQAVSAILPLVGDLKILGEYAQSKP